MSILDSYDSISSIDVDVGSCDIRLLSLSLVSVSNFVGGAGATNRVLSIYRACTSKGLGGVVCETRVCHVMRAHSVPRPPKRHAQLYLKDRKMPWVIHGIDLSQGYHGLYMGLN